MQEHSCQELKENTVDQSLLDDKSWEEKSDDVNVVGCNDYMNYQERYEFVQKRIYSPVKVSSLGFNQD